MQVSVTISYSEACFLPRNARKRHARKSEIGKSAYGDAEINAKSATGRYKKGKTRTLRFRYSFPRIRSFNAFRHPCKFKPNLGDAPLDQSDRIYAQKE